MNESFQEQFDEAWQAVDVVRYSQPNLFTFGDTRLKYTVIAPSEIHQGETVLREGQVVVQKPMIINLLGAEGVHLEGFGEFDQMPGFLIERMAYIPRLNYRNQEGRMEIVSTPANELIEQVIKKLDTEGDNLMGVMKSPAGAWQIGVLRYSVEKIVQSTPYNIQELRERGFLK